MSTGSVGLGLGFSASVHDGSGADANNAGADGGGTHASVAACTLPEMGHRGTFLVQMPTETTANSETPTSSSKALWNLNVVSGDPEESETQTPFSRQQLHFDAHTACRLGSSTST